MRVLQIETKVHMNFSYQINAALQQQRARQTLEGPLPLEPQSTMTSAMKQPKEITLTPRTKTANHMFIRRYSKPVMAQLPNHKKEVYSLTEEVMSVADNMKAVCVGHIPCNTLLQGFLGP